MRGLDFTPYRRSTVGFDRLFDFLENASRAEQDNYPPFDIEKLGDDTYRITLAVAGFKREDIDITAQQNMLIITGRRSENRNRDGNFLHVGIATRAFERRFELADFVRGRRRAARRATRHRSSADPEARKIDIGSGEATPLTPEPAEAVRTEARAEEDQTA